MSEVGACLMNRVKSLYSLLIVRLAFAGDGLFSDRPTNSSSPEQQN